MKAIIISLIIVVVSISSTYANTIMWYWHTQNEIVTYTVDVDDNIGSHEMTAFNHAIDIIAKNGEYSNLIQFQNKVNEIATGSIRNFTIVDVKVDER